jgi:nitrite reductase/ring-hydroxylating ferredoxin subunit
LNTEQFLSHTTLPPAVESNKDSLHETSSDGRAYGRPKATSDLELTQVGPGTPCGEMLRRYWHPIAQSANATTTPQKLRILGEDLILFRDGSGRAGLLHARCAHRGTTLYYGKVDERGIRCCYHGWQFDVEGRCIDQPCEPEGGKHRDKVRQPWYPLEERYGLVFAYMGPPAKKPVLPRYDILENLGADEMVFPSGPSGFGAGADDSVKLIPCNWLQQYENTMDPFHLTILHTRHRGVHFCPDLGAVPKVRFEPTERGLRYISSFKRLADGREVDRITPALMPNIRSVPGVMLNLGPSTHVVWTVPVDDTSHYLFQAGRVKKDFKDMANLFRTTRPVRYTDDDADRTPTRPKLWSELTPEEIQRYPSDWEAQVGQGPITLHSEENLATTDIGVVMLRRLLRQQIRIVQAGGDPMGVSFDPDEPVIKLGGHNVFSDDAVTA